MQPSVEQWHPVSIDDIPWAWLKEEKWRLHTFAKYPQVSAKSALLLAADGFAYIGVGRGLDDNVICYFCCATKSNWRPTDVISNVHKQLSPQCPMATGINCDNVPMTCPNGGSALFNKIYGQQRSSSAAAGSPKQKNDNEIETDSINHVNHDTNRRDMASAPSSNLTSGRIFANNSISRPPLQQQAHAEHHDADVTTSHQPSENDAPSSTVTSSNLTAWQSFESNNDIRFQQPVRQSANGNNRPVPAPSAGAASSSSSTPDRTNSTNARTGSRPSNPNPSISQTVNGTNNPQSQTTGAPSSSAGSQVSGSCTKPEGPTYAQLGIITERPKRYEYAVITKRLETFEHWPRDHHLKKEDLSEAGFYYAGYGDCARCFYCGGGLRNWEAEDDVWVEHARWFPKCAFIRQQMGQVFVDTVQELNKDYDQIPFAMVSNKIGKPASVFHLDSKDTPLKRDAAVRTVVEMGFDLKDVISAAEAIKDEATILSADRIYEKLLQENRSRNANVQHSSQDISSTDDVAKNLETMRTLKEQNNQLRQQTVCKICMDKEVAVVFLPCGHLVSCSDCAAAMKDCPVCRNSVKGVVRAFMG
ncbi:unnamed protein product [Lymnaea stagnalis]|uniref:RING-type domain-containing protein n=1 Tax=Lymnaea stagnalis TaxID=6523 RepID=A0AAV2H7Y3_LYMST